MWEDLNNNWFLHFRSTSTTSIMLEREYQQQVEFRSVFQE